MASATQAGENHEYAMHIRHLLFAILVSSASTHPPDASAHPGGGGAEPFIVSAAAGEASIRNGMGLEDYTLSYKNTDGTVLNFEQFSAGLTAGRSFSILKDSDRKRAVLSLDAVGASHEPQSSPNAIRLGATLPPYTGRDLAGLTFDSASLRGHVTLLDFYFADCVPCIAEVPMLNAIAETNPDLRVHAVTFEDRTLAQGFVDQHGFDWPVLPDAQGFIDAIGVRVYPTLLLLDADGIVRGVATGADQLTDVDALQAWIDNRLATPVD